MKSIHVDNISHQSTFKERGWPPLKGNIVNSHEKKDTRRVAVIVWRKIDPNVLAGSRRKKFIYNSCQNCYASIIHSQEERKTAKRVAINSCRGPLAIAAMGSVEKEPLLPRMVQRGPRVSCGEQRDMMDGMIKGSGRGLSLESQL